MEDINEVLHAEERNEVLNSPEPVLVTNEQTHCQNHENGCDYDGDCHCNENANINAAEEIKTNELEIDKKAEETKACAELITNTILLAIEERMKSSCGQEIKASEKTFEALMSKLNNGNAKTIVSNLSKVLDMIEKAIHMSISKADKDIYAIITNMNESCAEIAMNLIAAIAAKKQQ